MIRYVHIGDQINEDADEFAFFDTVTNRFLVIDDAETFASVRDFNAAAALQGLTDAARERCLGLVPSGPDRSPLPPFEAWQLRGLTAEVEYAAEPHWTEVTYVEPGDDDDRPRIFCGEDLLYWEPLPEETRSLAPSRHILTALYLPGLDGRCVWRRP